MNFFGRFWQMLNFFDRAGMFQNQHHRGSNLHILPIYNQQYYHCTICTLHKIVYSRGCHYNIRKSVWEYYTLTFFIFVYKMFKYINTSDTFCQATYALIINKIANRTTHYLFYDAIYSPTCTVNHIHVNMHTMNELMNQWMNEWIYSLPKNNKQNKNKNTGDGRYIRRRQGGDLLYQQRVEAQ
jgi:hypothetical protein